MNFDVGLDGLGKIATKLDTAGSDLADTDLAVFGEVDAGIVSWVVTTTLAEVAESAGNISAGMTGVGELVSRAEKYYRRADADVEATFAEINSALQRQADGD